MAERKPRHLIILAGMRKLVQLVIEDQRHWTEMDRILSRLKTLAYPKAGNPNA